MNTNQRTDILFICMGNICRSPLAENVFRHKARSRGVLRFFDIDSAGIGHWHIGEEPDPRARDVAQDHGVAVTGTGRQVKRRDFARFDYLICMDEDNRQDILDRGAPEEKVHLLLDFLPDAPMVEVPDPYDGGRDGFELVYKLVDAACETLLDTLLDRHVIERDARPSE
ncbi:MAG: low molecular weight phosphotyrosine protein phosphatase [Phycisphaerales bacterium]|nr:MAG: low molecular weight phosphotyrosine protein phosphatase [Phycisphaerales bacterium]